MIKKIIGCTAVFACLLFLARPASAVGIEAALGVWGQDPSGHISYKGTDLDFSDDLNFDNETKIIGRAKIETPGVLPNLYLMVTPVKFEGAGRKNVSFVFNGQTYCADTPFTSELRLNQYDVGLYYNLPFVETGTNGVVSAELGLDVRLADVKAEVIQPSTGLREKESFFAPVPMLYLGVEVKPVKRVSIGAELRGIAFSSNHAYDLIARLKVNIVGPLFVAAGYRYEDVKIDHDDLKAKVKIKGPFAEAGVVF